MFQMGEQFIFNLDGARPNPESVLQGNKYRITILTERLVRLEYNEDGVFMDQPTQTILYRKLPKPKNIAIVDENRYLTVTTDYFTLRYVKEASFVGPKIKPAANLSISLNGTGSVWYYGHPEAKNLGGLVKDLEGDKISFGKSLFSWDGFATVDDSKTMVFQNDGTLKVREGNSNYIDVYVFTYKNDFDKALQDYFLVTGRPGMIPRYALGNWWGRNLPYSDSQVREIVHHFQKSEIPLSVFLLDRAWHDFSGKDDYPNTGYTWNNDLFTNPMDTIQYLHSQGIRVGLNSNPIDGFGSNEIMYNNLLNFVGPKEEGGRVPFLPLDPKYMDAFLKVMIHPIDNMGVDFWWVDYPNTNLSNLFALNHYQFYDMYRNYQRRPMILSRQAGIAQHRYPVVYTGRTTVGWETLRNMVVANLSAANIGVSWSSHDIGGFHNGTEDGELYTRYIQLGVFSPILRMDSDGGRYYKREPWRWNAKTFTIAKKYLQLRNSLIPYIYASAYDYYLNGVPVVTPLYHKYPEIYDDPYVRYQYYFGSQLLVAPILDKEDPVMDRVVHKVFIPNGVWYDFVTGKKFPGKRKYITFFKDDEYPVYARAGAIIPLATGDSAKMTVVPTDMEIHIFPGRSNSYRLYEDDGISSIYKKGYYIITEIEYTYSSNNYALSIRPIEGKAGIIPEQRNYHIRFRNTRQPEFVEAYVNGMPVQVDSYIDNTDFVVNVKDVPTINQLIVNCRGKNIEIDAIRVVNEEIKNIISDLAIETKLKDKIDSILFSNKSLQTKRVEIRLLGRKHLDKKFVRLFLRMLEYIGQI